MLPANIRIEEHRGNAAPPAPATTPSPALTAALAPLRAYRVAHPFPSRSTLHQITPEQFATRAQIWDRDYLNAHADQARAETIQAMEAEVAALKAQIGGAT